MSPRRPKRAVSGTCAVHLVNYSFFVVEAAKLEGGKPET